MSERWWSERRARAVLDDAADRLASGTGMSDRTLTRLARLQAPETAANEAAFRLALSDAGWGRQRIDEALVLVRGRALRSRLDGFGDRVLARIAHVHALWIFVAFLALGVKAVAILAAWLFANAVVAMGRARNVLAEREEKVRRARRRRLGRGS